ncbi:MAG: serine hydrolase [Gemmatimonadetes bacterium]|nr:serine hydrolase [Gemmatimonadota bacterium]
MRNRVVVRCAILFSMALAYAGCAPQQVEVQAEGEGEVSLEARIQARLDSLPAVTSMYAKHLPTGRELAIRADLPLSTRSAIKVAVMVQAYRDADEGRLNLDARHEVTPDELRGGSGLLKTFAPGLRPTNRDLITQMIITSDNTATDIVLKTVGRDRVNQMLRELGYKETRMQRSTGELFKARWLWEDSSYASLTDREVFEKGSPRGGPEVRQRDLAFAMDSTQWLGRSTTREMSRLLEQIYTGQVASKRASEEMTDILLSQFYTSRLPQRVRFQGVRVAHKTGDGPPYVGNDVGILFYEGGPTVVSVFVYENRGSFFDVEATIGQVAEDLVNGWK